MKKLLIFGYGNPGRQDDALGILLVESMENWAKENGLKSLVFDSNYQLNIEDALAISEYETVIFVDASIEEIQHIKLTKVRPCQKTEFTMHAMAPEFVLHLCQSLYNKFPKAYLLHIKGYEFDFLGKLTFGANENLDKAKEFLKGICSESKNIDQLLDQFIENQQEEMKIDIS